MKFLQQQLLLVMIDFLRKGSIGAWAYNHFSTALYVIGGIIGSLRYFGKRFRIADDGLSMQGTYPSLWIANTFTYSLGWSVTPLANSSDGRLDLHACRWSGLCASILLTIGAKRHWSWPKVFSLLRQR
jgi:hypothetical protein